MLGQYQLSEAPSFGRRDESLMASDIDQARSRAFEWCKEMLMGSDIHHSRRRVGQLLYWVKPLYSSQDLRHYLFSLRLIRRW